MGAAPPPQIFQSGIRPAPPGDDRAILAERHALYQAARARTPRRWSGETRDWTPIGAVTLNPERDAVVPIIRNDIQVAA